MNNMEETYGRPTMLIVDDDSAIREHLHSVLAGEPFDVVIANDAAMMLKLVRRELPDIILLDVMMPGIDGLEACRRMKAIPGASDVPVIFMTGLTSSEYKIEAFRAGAVDYINKPVEEAELLARVRTQLSLRTLTKALKEQNARQERQLKDLIEAEAARERLTEELRQANLRLSKELAERERTEAARAGLQEQVIAVQREKVLELSTPLIPITDWLVVMPLVGTMDIERARRTMEVALHGAAARRSRFVILDITGIREISADVAGVLVQTGNGLRLLGAHAVITGVAPEVARTLGDLNIELGSLVTRATLQDGIVYAIKACAGDRGAQFDAGPLGLLHRLR